MFFRPSWKNNPYVTQIGELLLCASKRLSHWNPSGIIIVFVGQALRSMAMIQASTNFSHLVAHNKAEGHRLVKEGVYSCVSSQDPLKCILTPNHRWFRHPSYTGFFYWAVGTQMVLQNHVCFFVFVALLWRFFYHRIRCKFLMPVTGILVECIQNRRREPLDQFLRRRISRIPEEHTYDDTFHSLRDLGILNSTFVFC